MGVGVKMKEGGRGGRDEDGEEADGGRRGDGRRRRM